MLSLLTIAAALADSPGIGLRLSGELLQDRNLAVNYGSNSLSADGVVLIPLPNHLEIGLSAGYRRLGGSLSLDGAAVSSESSWIWYAPIQVTLGLRVPVDKVFVYADAGPSVVAWEEKVPEEPALGIGSSGGKLGLVGEAGVAVPLPVSHSLHDPQGGFGGLELTGTLGYRYTLPRFSGCVLTTPCGLSFSALRASVGVMVRL
jgi:hypothetical protein